MDTQVKKAAYFDTGCGYFALELNGHRVGKIEYGKMRNGRCEGYDEARQVCEEIVRVCNGHGELVAAAQAVLEHYEPELPYNTDATCPKHGLLTRLRLSIAKAEGK